jgi:hypothetical protein
MRPPAYDAAFAIGQDVVTVGRLHLPSGRVVACDPYFCADATPFTREVPPGDYDVQVRRVDLEPWGPRIALARILFEPARPPVGYEAAVRDASDAGAYFVDSGTGSFMDEVTRQAFADVLAEYYGSGDRSANYYTDVLAAEFKRSAVDPDDPRDLGRWNMHRLPGSALNVAMFSTGLGDGSFESAWGVDGDGLVTSLVTDFRLL